MVTDPVCKMSLAPEAAAAKVEYAGRVFYFCSLSCHAAFTANPAAYAGAGEATAPQATGGNREACATHATGAAPDLRRAPLAKSTGFGALAALALLGLYLSVLTLVSGWSFTTDQFSQYWYFIVALALGFGVQVGLYVHLRSAVHQAHGSGKVVAVSGATSGAAMVSCCTHYLVNLLPALGATGLVTLVGQYQVQLFWVGLAANLLGIAYVGRRLMLFAKGA
ncbi:MAG: YHS domain-containing protein [Pseudomonadota bacterium]